MKSGSWLYELDVGGRGSMLQYEVWSEEEDDGDIWSGYGYGKITP